MVVCGITGLIGYIQQTAKLTHLLADEDTKELLRQQQIPEEMYDTFQEYEKNSEFSRYHYLTAYLLTEKTAQEDLDDFLDLLCQFHPQNIQAMEHMESAVWEDLQYFPIPLSGSDSDLETSFENSWMFDRNFGGNRGHEGTDIMASINDRGHYPIVSMTDGVVEKIGWLELGGYRIGIRSPNGGYFYYAHLYDYAREFQEGEEIKAGELLGFMGDSGYGPEGTTGKFAVHLHVGIYVDDETGRELSFNPYYVLKWLEPKRLSYSY
ncbi:MAG: M23 family metallopeptidase [Lachnospiraceae bacterium]|nr:M23 family metallopeptidase [Lachnospiraceae bacterium]